MSFAYTIRAADGRVFSDMDESTYVQTARDLIDAGVDFSVSASRVHSLAN